MRETPASKSPAKSNLRGFDSSRQNRSSQLVAPALIVLAAVIACHGSFGVPFFFDDAAAITNNPTIRDLWRIGAVLSPPADGGGVTGRPIVNLSLAINHAMSGTDVRDYHVFNLLVHCISALTLFGVVRRTLLQRPLSGRLGPAASSLALLVALLWTVHPLQTESVTCVIQRTELLVGMFYLLTLYCFVRCIDHSASRVWRGLAIVSCALGMASKEVMVSAPLMILLYDRTFVAGTFRTAWQRRWRLHLGLAATWLMLAALLIQIGGSRGAAAGFGLGVTWWSYALKQCEAIVTYLALSFWPHPLVVDYGTGVITDPILVAPQIALVVLLIGTMLAALRWRPTLGFMMSWVFAILAPSSSVLPLVSQTMAEHRMYLPLAAVLSLAVMVGHALFEGRTRRSDNAVERERLDPKPSNARATGSKRVGFNSLHLSVIAARTAKFGSNSGQRLGVLGGLIVLALCTLTVARNRTMQDEVVLWSDTVAKVPMNARAHGALGLALSDRGQGRDALPHFQKALELDRRSVATEQNIGNVYYRLGDFAAAAEHYRKAVALDPRFASGYNNLGAALWELRETEDALRSYRTAISLDPNHAGAHQNVARALLALNRFSEAAAHYEHVQRLQPASADAHYDLGLALARAGMIDRAAHHFGVALRLRPSAGSHLNYARFLENAGRINEAITSLETALRLQPDFAEARRERDRLRSAAGTPAPAR